MRRIFKPGDLAIVIVQTGDEHFEFPHIMRGDIVKVVSVVPRKVIPNRNPDVERVWSECDVEAPDGSVWPSAFSALKPLKPDEKGSWEGVKDAIGWTPSEESA